jgi:hypothetical protein
MTAKKLYEKFGHVEIYAAEWVEAEGQWEFIPLEDDVFLPGAAFKDNPNPPPKNSVVILE